MEVRRCSLMMFARRWFSEDKVSHAPLSGDRARRFAWEPWRLVVGDLGMEHPLKETSFRLG